MIVVEATAAAPDGHINRGDLGLWQEDQIELLARIVAFSRESNRRTDAYGGSFEISAPPAPPPPPSASGRFRAFACS
jgi:2,4-dienoyl-CoA reductase-like NADH-dependent reductase (Old Yellow Enzyme family)